MSFDVHFTPAAQEQYQALRQAALAATKAREELQESKTRRAEGLFRQVVKCVNLLSINPRHPGLRTHEFNSLENPYRKGDKVFEAYIQNRTPGAYRLFWCYGPGKKDLTVIAITPHP